MGCELNYVVRFVTAMSPAVAFFRDVLGLKVRFETPEWTEFETGSTTLALHTATDDALAGTCQLGLCVDDVQAFYRDMTAKGFCFTAPPRAQHGIVLARFRSLDGAEITVSSRGR